MAEYFAAIRMQEAVARTVTLRWDGHAWRLEFERLFDAVVRKHGPCLSTRQTIPPVGSWNPTICARYGILPGPAMCGLSLMKCTASSSMTVHA